MKIPHCIETSVGNYIDLHLYSTKLGMHYKKYDALLYLVLLDFLEKNDNKF